MDRITMAIKQSRRSDEKLALLFLDLDDFKAVNDTLGHEAGDHVLHIVAKRMLKAVREDDTVCRIGGDEFMILLPGLKNNEAPEQISRRLLEIIGREIIYRDTATHVGASIGIAFNPDNASDADPLRRAADSAMYQAKHRRKNNFCFA